MPVYLKETEISFSVLFRKKFGLCRGGLIIPRNVGGVQKVEQRLKVDVVQQGFAVVRPSERVLDYVT
jgi:hypothetical protein